MPLNSSFQPISPGDSVRYGVARARDLAFDAVHSLWRKRQAEGMTQSDLAKAIGRDEGWVSRTLNGPGNWTIRTIATLVQGLNGELEIGVHALEDPTPIPSNYDAYHAYSDAWFACSTATANTDIRRTWGSNDWQPDLILQGSDDRGNVLVEIKS